MDAAELAARLGLEPHPEGGWYRETWREPEGSAIYFLLRAGEVSHWHRVAATEIWHHYDGDPIELRTSADGVSVASRVLGPDFGAGQEPQLVVPATHWQAARTLGAWTLVGCTVSPRFEFSMFELAPPGWEPG